MPCKQDSYGVALYLHNQLSIYQLKTMKNNLHADIAPVRYTVMKLALLGGAVLSCMYGVLLLFSTALHVIR